MIKICMPQLLPSFSTVLHHPPVWQVGSLKGRVIEQCSDLTGGPAIQAEPRLKSGLLEGYTQTRTCAGHYSILDPTACHMIRRSPCFSRTYVASVQPFGQPIQTRTRTTAWHRIHHPTHHKQMPLVGQVQAGSAPGQSFIVFGLFGTTCSVKSADNRQAQADQCLLMSGRKSSHQFCRAQEMLRYLHCETVIAKMLLSQMLCDGRIEYHAFSMARQVHE